MRGALWTLVLVVFASGCTVTGSFTQAPMNTSGTVVDATDGDTLRISVNDSIKTIRLIGVDAPETYGEVSPEEFDLEDTPEKRECLRAYGERAKELAEETEAREVRLYQDPVQNLTGGYGRTLAYVYDGERSLNEDLLRKGFARVYVSEFQEADRYMTIQRAARDEKRGLWGC